MQLTILWWSCHPEGQLGHGARAQVAVPTPITALSGPNCPSQRKMVWPVDSLFQVALHYNLPDLRGKLGTKRGKLG